METNQIKQLADAHALEVLGIEQYKTNPDAAQSIADDFTAGVQAALAAVAAAPDPASAIGQLMAAHSLELMDVFRERQRQLAKFGPQNRTPQEWFLIFAEEVGEVAKECVELQFDDADHPHANPANFYKEMVESVAVGLAALQNFNQRRGYTVKGGQQNG